MDARAELWEAYKPKLAEARKLDRLEGTLVFLAQPASIGRFRIAPMTLERLLTLEALNSPFVVPDLVPQRGDVLRALWVLSPYYRPSKCCRRIFCAANYFCQWRKHAMVLSELLAASMEIIGNDWKREGKAQAEPDPLWVANIIDGFASQYGWGIREILNLPLLQVAKMGEALGARVGAGNGGIKATGRHTDAIKFEYLDRVRKLDAAEAFGE